MGHQNRPPKKPLTYSASGEAKVASVNGDELDDLSFESYFEEKEDYIPWKHGGFKIYSFIKRLFCSPSPKKELNLLEQVSVLLNTEPGEPSSPLIEKCKQFIQLHRIVENTSARKRLEKWAKRIIVWYLITVFIIILLNNNGDKDTKSWYLLSLSDSVLITLLSTTTVNIIGLGLIILRGHFYTKEHFDDKKESEKAD